LLCVFFTDQFQLQMTDADDYDFNEFKVTTANKVSDKKRRKDKETDTSVKEKPNESSHVPKKLKKSPYGIWMGNLPFSVTEQELKDFFKDLEISRLNHNQKRGYAHVDFSNSESFEKALLLSETELSGRRVLIKNNVDFEVKGKPRGASGAIKEAKKQPQQIESDRVFVGNLSFESSQNGVQAAFNKFGDVKNVKMSEFEDSGKCKGYAWITFDSVENARKAVKSIVKLDGRVLRVEFSPIFEKKGKAKRAEATQAEDNQF
jgi:RNA recognition motif-containing protein